MYSYIILMVVQSLHVTWKMMHVCVCVLAYLCQIMLEGDKTSKES